MFSEGSDQQEERIQMNQNITEKNLKVEKGTYSDSEDIFKVFFYHL